MTTIAPTIETTKDFILIKIPRRIFSGKKSAQEKISLLEQGLQESFKEVEARKFYGPFRGARTFLRALRKPLK